MLLKNTAFIVFIIIIIFAGIVYFVLDFGLLSCCNRESAPIAGEENLVVEYEAIIPSKIGEETTIVLESNPTTGFQWQVGYDSGKLELVSQKFVAPEEIGLVGASGEEIFVFKALTLGESKITFLYLRPWETDVEPEKVLYYKIIVEE